MPWTIAEEILHAVAHADVPRQGKGSGAALGGKAGSVPGLSAPFLIRSNELHYVGAEKVLLPPLLRFWSLCLSVRV